MVVRYAVSNENRLADFSMDFSKVFFESRIPSVSPNGNNIYVIFENGTAQGKT
jgi:hypothetical protein